MKYSLRKLSVSLSAIISVTAPTQLAMAQTDGQNDEIIVTAQRRAESIQSVPVAVTAFDESNIETKQIRSVLDLGGLVPNAQIVNGTGPANSARLFFRGIGEDDSRNPDPAVGTYVDGIFVGRSIGALIEIADVEQIEVLRGPQGTLYGRNSNGGAIKITSIKPQDETSLSIDGGYGSNGRWLAKAVGNLRLSDKTALRVGGFHRERDAFHTLTPNGELAANAKEVGKQNVTSVRGSLRHHMNSDWTGTLTVDFTKDKSEPIPSSIIAESNSADVVTDADGNIFTIEPVPGSSCSASTPGTFLTVGCFSDFRSDVESFGATLNVEGKLGGLDVVSLTGYRTLKDDLSTHISFPYTQVTDQKQFSQEITVSSNSEGPFNLVGGMFYYNEDVTLDSVFILRHITTTNTDSIALFAQGTFDISEKLSAVGGLRYTNENRDFTGEQNTVTAATDPVTGTVETDNVNYTAKLEYQAMDTVFAYGSIASGFKTPGFSADCFRAVACFRNVNEEKVTTYEAGIRTDLADNRFRVNATYFYSDYADLQINATVPGLGFSRTNAANARIQGLEIESTFRPTSNLELFGNIGWLDAEYVDLTLQQAGILTASGASCAEGMVTVACAVGLDMKNAPEFKSNAGFLWIRDLNDGEFTFGADASYEEESFALVANNPGSIVEPGVRVNSRIGFTPKNGNWNVSLWVKNLTDKTYYQATVGANQVYAAAPRTLGIDFGINF